MVYANIREEELKLKVAQDFFSEFDCSRVIGDIDFCVSPRIDQHKQIELFEYPSLLWAEAKRGKSNIYKSLTQLILTIGKARAFNNHLPPPYLAAFDFEHIAFIPYIEVQDIFYTNDFNWNVAPSNHDTYEFTKILSRVQNILDQHSCIFTFYEPAELKSFISQSFAKGQSGSKIQIDKNNFVVVYNRWLSAVMPSININWEEAKNIGIMYADFYLADLLSSDNTTIRDELYVILRNHVYVFGRQFDKIGSYSERQIIFKNQSMEAHNQFWNKYERPPQEDYWDYIVDRRDLLVPQDIRERKGSFYTPLQWVELSQQYIAQTLGANWQEEYYVWDCAAGTGNLLTGLSNARNLYASTIDIQDVDIMRDRIKNGANLWESHVFQFDFLNDNFSRLPHSLQDIIQDNEKRKRLIIYINPPYAEVSSIQSKKRTGGKIGVNQSLIHNRYNEALGTAGREVYAQFLLRIVKELPGAILAEFSKIKTLQGSAFVQFRKHFTANLLRMFVVPSNTFDNVRGQFPIGFKIWQSDIESQSPLSSHFKSIVSDVYNGEGECIGKKTFRAHNKSEFINKWINKYRIKIVENTLTIGYLDGINSNDFQHQQIVYLVNSKEQLPNPRGIWVDYSNLIPVSVYLAVRHCIQPTWINASDQFLNPNDKWQSDEEFQSDCVCFVLFSNKNTIQSEVGMNHWIPFTEEEVGARDTFMSNFMTKFIQGKFQKDSSNLEYELIQNKPIKFSSEAQLLFSAGRDLWKYYHKQSSCLLNASFYEIRDYFQGRNEQGRMKANSADETYTQLIAELRRERNILKEKIATKIYDYGFLLK